MVDISAARESDLDRITEIYADAVRHGTASYELEPPSRAEMGSRFAALAGNGFPYIVAEDDGGVLGYA
jgi:phosphinothricin acetyltransferase